MEDTSKQNPNMSLKLWLVAGAFFLLLGMAALLTQQSDVVAQDNQGLPCLSCHTNKVLKAHDKLGEGNQACYSCHSSTDMKTWHLASGNTPLPRSDSARLCGQCHQDRYESWQEGIHGVPAWREGEPEVRGSAKLSCVNCHNPHQPQIFLSNPTRPHPEPAAPPPAPPTDLMAMGGISVAVMVVLTLLRTRKNLP